MRIEINNLSKKYRNNNLFKKVDLILNDKQLIFITGASGSGKSSLLNLIGGLENINEGSINFFEEDKLILTLDKNKQIIPKEPQIDFIFQEFNLINELSAIENLYLGSHLKEQDISLKELKKYFALVDLDWKRAKNKVQLLSGGEKQRLSILRSLIRNSAIILADEPTGNLDTKNSEAVFKLLKEISKQKMVIIVSHDLESAKKYGDRIISLKDGEIIDDQIVENDFLENEFTEDERLSALRNDEDKKRKTKNSFSKYKSLPFIFKKDIKTKWTQSLILIVLFIFSILTVTSLVQFTTVNHTINTTALNRVLEEDLVSVDSAKLGVDNDFERDILPKLESNFRINKIVPLYSRGETFFTNTTSHPKKEDTFFMAIDNSAFFRNRYQDSLISGRLPENANEITITPQLINLLELDNPLGQNIMFFDDSLINPDFGDATLQKQLKIVGITNKKKISGEGISFVNSQLINDAITQEEKKTAFQISLIRNTIDQNLGSINNYDTVVNIADLVAASNNDQLINFNSFTSRVPNNDKEMMISNQLLKNERLLTNSTIDAEFLNFVQNNQWNLLGFFQINPKPKIVGIYHDTKPTVKMRAQDITYWSTPRAFKYQFYLNNPSNVQNFMNSVKNLNNNLEADIESSQLAGLISNSTRQANLILSIIMLAFIALTIIFVLIYSKFLADAKAKDSGILKSLGASSFLVSIFHLTNIFFVSLVSLVSAIILYFPLQEIFSATIQNYQFLSQNVGTAIEIIIGIWAILTLSAMIIYYFIGLYYFRKKTILLLKK